MATAVAEKPSGSSPFETQVESELGRAANRVRLNDALTGAAALAVLGLGFAVVGILLDRWLDIPEWVRQLQLAGFLAVAGWLGYALVVRPYRQTVNPRYVARQVEETIPDAKNALINWVDLKDRDLATPIRTSVSARAANGLAEADVGTAVDSKRLIWLAGLAGVCVAALAVLFVVCKPAQFFSLLGRTFTPFTAAPIANRTQLTLTEPANGDVTVTTGEPVTVAVTVDGSVPNADSPDRVRLQFRHNPSGEYDEIPLEAGQSNREWSVRIPPHVLQNGVWYRVAGGDAVTPEHRVTVRSRPMFKAFQTEYVYPAYTRIPPEKGEEPRVEALRGVQVTLTAQTNRTDLKAGRMMIDGQPSIAGDVVGPNRDALRFKLTLKDSGAYRLSFVTAAGETSDPTPAYPIKVIADEAPLVTITIPDKPDVTLPANGLLTVEGNVSDDYGVAQVRLMMQVAGAKAVPLQSKLYLGMESLLRKTDGTFPRNLGGGNPDEPGYKESVRLEDLKTEAGAPALLKEGTELEFWLEATDNCEPKPNVGRSALPRKKVRLTAPEVAKPADDAKTKAHQEALKNKLDRENRNPGGAKPDVPPTVPDKQPETPKGTDPAADDLQKKAQELQDEINKQKNQPGEAKPGDNAATKPEEKPAEGKNGKPDPANGGAAESKTGEDPNAKPDPNDPMNGGGASASKSEGKVEPPPAPAESKSEPKPDPSKPESGSQGESKNAPKDGNDSGLEKPGQQGGDSAKPDQQGGDSKPNDPKGGNDSQAGKQPGAGKPQTKPDRGEGNETPQSQPGENTPPEERPGDTKGQKPTPNGAGKAPPKEKPDAESKAGPGEKNADQSETKPEGSQANSGGQADPKEKPTGGKSGSGKPDSKEIEKAVNDLNSPDPQKREQAEKTLEQAGGKDAVDRGKQAANDMKSPDQLSREQGERDKGELSRELGRDGQPEPDKGDVDRLTRNANDLASEDQKTRERAEKEFEDKLSKKNQQEMKQAANDAKSNDPNKAKAGKEKVDELAKKAAANDTAQKNAKQNGDLAKKAEDLASGDKGKQDAAQKEFEDKLSKKDQNDLKQAAQDLKSGDKAKEQAAKDKIDELSKKAGDAARAREEKTKADAKDLAKKAGDLASPDKAKQEAAEKDFAKNLDKADRDALKQAAKDAQSGDPAKEKAAKEKIDELSKKAAKNAADKDKADLAKQADDLGKKAEDLASGDKAKRDAAEKDFAGKLDDKDKTDLKQAAEDLKSNDPNKQKAAKEKIDDLSKKAAENAKAERDAKELAEKAADLASKDEAKRKAAEKEFDEKLGQDKRKELQKQMEKLASGDPKKQEEALKDLADMAKGKVPDRDGEGDDPKNQWKPGSGSFKGPDGKPWEDNPKNRLKAGQMQLAEFEKNKYNKELQDRLGMSEEDYAKFLDGYRERVARLKDEVENPAKDPVAGNYSPLRVTEGTGGTKLENRSDGTTVNVGAGSAVAAPPGYTDAQKRFAEEAAKLRRGGK